MVCVRDDFALQLYDRIIFLARLASELRYFLQELGILTGQGVTQNQQFGGCQPCIGVQSTCNTSEDLVNLLQHLE